jgi:alcohol dehydrogenase
MERFVVLRDSALSWETQFGRSRVVFGAGSLDRVGELSRDLGATRILLVTDRGLRETNHFERALEILREASLRVAVYDGVEANPTTRHVAEGLEVGRKTACDCIVALGGGSSMDCAKGVNFLLTQGGRMEDYRGWGKAPGPMLPSIGIPTTAGTGSEAQSYALICEEGSGAKMACGDKKAIFGAVVIDPALAATVAPGVAAVSGIDAIAHAVESYVSRKRNPISQLFSAEAWRLLNGAFPAVTSRGPRAAETKRWGEMMLGAFFAGAAIEHSMLGAAHACANPLTARFAIAHGAAVGIMLPGVIRFNAAVVGPLYDELCQSVAPDGGSVSLDERVQELRASAKLPVSLRDCDVPKDELNAMAEEAEAQWTAAFNPRSVTRGELLELYEAAY